ncbi:hypothetical protein HPP92_017221 [Vanilla planifolia]|uniref:Uncharacterized protein n=1 Tax=Vanilla planifolia TaxID=51239 RepID=A0A835QAQ9_VANPL|nr:hypothetical protein HPP92_017221 [Vanilla planifolia]
MSRRGFDVDLLAFVHRRVNVGKNLPRSDYSRRRRSKSLTQTMRIHGEMFFNESIKYLNVIKIFGKYFQVT